MHSKNTKSKGTALLLVSFKVTVRPSTKSKITYYSNFKTAPCTDLRGNFGKNYSDKLGKM